jgi:hypothetical protein
MRFLLFLLIFTGCSKTKYVPIETISKPETRFVWDETSLNQFNKRIDVLVAFLWPDVIKTTTQKAGVRKIISRSRELRDFKGKFLIQKIKLEEDYNSQDCPCVLDSLCTGDETHDDLELCLSLEEKKYAHQANLAAFFLIVEDIRQTVESIGGIWVKTNTEYPEAPLSSINYQGRQLNLEVFEVNNQSAPLNSTFQLNFEKGFPHLTWAMDVNGQAWLIEASLEVQVNLLSGQGEISSGSRKGVIYWEQSPR